MFVVLFGGMARISLVAAAAAASSAALAFAAALSETTTSLMEFNELAVHSIPLNLPPPSPSLNSMHEGGDELDDYAYTATCLANQENSYHACESPIYCNARLLDRIQRSGIFLDDKQFVDMPTKRPVQEVLASFEELERAIAALEGAQKALQIVDNKKKDGPDPVISLIHDFIQENFWPVGFDLQVVVPGDWQAEPAFLAGVKDEDAREVGRVLHEKWKSLTRSFDRSRLCPACSTTSLLLVNPFVIPGGRFREFYYWDTFWILEGLYVSEMWQTARGTLENMVGVIEAVGFVPNGSRIYYLNRSQPPMFTRMLSRYFEVMRQAKTPTNCGYFGGVEREFAMRALAAADREYLFWMEHRAVLVQKAGDSISRVARVSGPGFYSQSLQGPRSILDFLSPSLGEKFVLNVYGAALRGPRPESFSEDVGRASELPEQRQRIRYFHNVAAAAESGWDFSARWLASDSQMTSMECTEIAPVDLNALMYSNERWLAEMHEAAASGTDKESVHRDLAGAYRELSQKRLDALQGLFWDGHELRWRDWHLRTRSFTPRPFYLSDLAPLFYQAYSDESKVDPRRILQAHLSILQDHPAGVPVSHFFSGQQWDAPNVWAPLQYELLALYDRLACGDGFYEGMAASLATRWIQSISCGLRNYGHVFEKYHADLPGQPGGGGEYIVQEGFAWTNAVSLWILQRFGSQVQLARTADGRPVQCPRGDRVKPIKCHAGSSSAFL